MNLNSLVLFFIILTTSCVTESPEPGLNIRVAPKTEQDIRPAKSQLKSLKSYAEPGSPEAQLVADVYYILRAEDSASKDQHITATKWWFKSLQHADGSFAKVAFEGWLKKLYETNRVS